MSPVTRDRHEWEGRGQKQTGVQGLVEDDRCGCEDSSLLLSPDGDGDGDEMRSVVAWGPDGECSALAHAGRGGAVAVLARAFHRSTRGGKRLPSAGPI